MNKALFSRLLSTLVVLASSRSATMNELPRTSSNQFTPEEHRIIGSQRIAEASSRTVAKTTSPILGVAPLHTAGAVAIPQNIQGQQRDNSRIFGRIAATSTNLTGTNEFASNVVNANGDKGKKAESTTKSLGPELTLNSGNADLNESERSADNTDVSSNEELNGDQGDGNGDKSEETGDTTEPSNEDQPSTQTAPPQAISIKILPGRTAEITIVAPAGSAYRVERSLDLVNWSLLAKGIANSTFQDKDAVNHSSAFYRVVPK